MKTIILMLVLALAVAAPNAPAAAHGTIGAPIRLAKTVSDFYCQGPGAERWWACNAMTYYNTEMADEIPNTLVGQEISQVTLYVSEWDCSSWRDPQGLAINFYDQTCPPGTSPVIHFEIPWSHLQSEVIQDNGYPFWYVRRATAILPNAVTIRPNMSIGGVVLEDWSYGEHGWAGLIMTSDYDVAGCEFYMDDAFQGYPRWTPGSATPWWEGIPHDLAYCLGSQGPVPTQPTTWGQLKNRYR